MRTALTVGLFFLLAAAAFPAEQPMASVRVGAFTFTVPDGWKTVTPSSPMRKAQLEIAQGSDKAEVTFFQFGAGEGGTPAENVARWFAQFPGSDAKRKTENVQAGSVKITFAATGGTFSSGMPGGPTTPMTDYALCGAILESPDGNIFIKMTGPEPVVKSATETLKKMVCDAAKNSAPQA
jgi:lipoprotein-anchoring transpeptidase ErfK/SrfK